MSQIIKNTILNYIPNQFSAEEEINNARIFELNNSNIKKGRIIYLCEREIRAKDNFALQFGLQKSKELNLPFEIIHPKINYQYEPKQNFVDKQIKQAQQLFNKFNLNFQIIDKSADEIISKKDISILITDFNPIIVRDYSKMNYRVYEIDGHNIIPARFVSDKQEYSAATLRRKIYRNIYPFLTEYENLTNKRTEADYVLQDFIKNKLHYYAEFKNNMEINVLSGLSKYLNLGFISSQRVALEVIKSNAEAENKEEFLEELVIRKELSDNFCLYCDNFKDFSNIPTWAKISLNQHKSDLRSYIYSIEELEYGRTHDKLWNATQMQLMKEGVIHGYLRMYWAKKILEWTNFPEKALEIAIYLNDKYAFDSPSANGYVGILWAIGGLHDRAFIDYPVTGKIRRMTYDSIKRKIKIEKYIQKYSWYK